MGMSPLRVMHTCLTGSLARGWLRVLGFWVEGLQGCTVRPCPQILPREAPTLVSTVLTLTDVGITSSSCSCS